LKESFQTRDVQSQIDSLQGEWGDDIGLTIQISGDEARFSDVTSRSWKFEAAQGALNLRGAELVGSVAAPVWRFPTGVERYWARFEAAGSGDSDWAALFLRYKDERLQLRQMLSAAFENHDMDKLMTLKSAWEDDSDVRAVAGLSEEQRSALAAGRFFVPGSCFRHRKFDYRGVILGCDPWCTYPAAWRARWVENRPDGEAQPFYHCLVDERDRPGRQSRYVAEENLQLSDVVFPIKATLADMLLLQCNGLGAYLPGPELSRALQKQRLTFKFNL